MAKRRKHHTKHRRKISGFGGKDMELLTEIGAGAAGALVTATVEASAAQVTSNTDLQAAAPLIVGGAVVYFFRKNKFARTAGLVMASNGLANLLKDKIPGLSGILGTPLLGTPLLGPLPGIAEYPGIANRTNYGSGQSSGQASGWA